MKPILFALVLLASTAGANVNLPDPSELAIALDQEARTAIILNEEIAAEDFERAAYHQGKADAYREMRFLIKYHDAALADRPIPQPIKPRPVQR